MEQPQVALQAALNIRVFATSGITYPFIFIHAKNIIIRIENGGHEGSKCILQNLPGPLAVEHNYSRKTILGCFSHKSGVFSYLFSLVNKL